MLFFRCHVCLLLLHLRKPKHTPTEWLQVQRICLLLLHLRKPKHTRLLLLHLRKPKHTSENQNQNSTAQLRWATNPHLQNSPGLPAKKVVVGRTHIRPTDHMKEEVFLPPPESAPVENREEVLKMGVLDELEGRHGLKMFDEGKWNEVAVKANGKLWEVAALTRTGKTVGNGLGEGGLGDGGEGSFHGTGIGILRE